MHERPPTYSIIMVVHNTRAMTQMATLRTLRHIAGHDARLIVVDNASTDGAAEWLALLAQRGDIDLIRSGSNIGHGPAIELARRAIQSPYIVTLDSDAFPLADDWLPQLRGRLEGTVKVVGIRHHRDYIHPSCLMIARQTLEEFNLSFLDEKDRPSKLDVAERISQEIKRRGYQIAGLERTSAQRRGSASEPVYLGSEYAGLVYHQWYTTRAAVAEGRQVDDVPTEAIEGSLYEVFEHYHAEVRDVTVVMGLRSASGESRRLYNAIACLRALNLQSLPRWRYWIIVVEQDHTPQLEEALAPLVDRYIFAYNPGPYNRGWAFNIGAVLPASRTGVLCLIDADILVPPDFLRHGLAAVQAGQRAVLPYNEIVYLDAASTERAIQERLAAPSGTLNAYDFHGQVFTTSQGGCIWVEAALYHEIGGHDERFRGWGHEDRELWDRLARATPIARLSGRLLHLDHPRPAMEDTWALANQSLYEHLSTRPTTKPDRPMGDPELYSGKEEYILATASSPVLGKREWENWHRWDSARIEHIVRDERHRMSVTSSRRQLAEILVQLGDSLLDVGCGPGALWPHFEPYRLRFSWAGVDVTHEMVAAARRLFPHVPVHYADAGSLPFDQGSFDIVLLRHVLDHLPPWLMECALSEAMRVARRAVAVDFYLPPMTQGTRRIRRVGENFLEIRWTVRELETPIVNAGWRVRERRTIAGTPGETNILWILAPQQEHTRPGQVSPTSPRLEPFKISIIMPTYLRSHTIFRTVAMIQTQTYRNWELIVIDNAGDYKLSFDDPRIRVYCHADQPSASYARNHGLQYVTGDLVCFFDDDDDMFPTYLERFAAAFQANPNAKMVRCGMIVSEGVTNFSYATPECCLWRRFATPTWSGNHSAQDQLYFTNIASANGWSEAQGDIVVIHEALCRANAESRGGLRSGHY
jgi:glycosyltransferase involved in cell wall biosynthesis